MIIDVVIEMPKRTRIRYHYKNGILSRGKKLKRPLPENYGCIPNTIMPDGEDLDVVVLTNEPLKRGPARVRAIGAIMREDGDDKIIAVLPNSKLRIIHDIPKDKFKKLLKAWTGNPGQAPLKRIVSIKEAIKIIKQSKRIQTFS